MRKCRGSDSVQVVWALCNLERSWPAHPQMHISGSCRSSECHFRWGDVPCRLVRCGLLLLMEVMEWGGSPNRGVGGGGGQRFGGAEFRLALRSRTTFWAITGRHCHCMGVLPDGR